MIDFHLKVGMVDVFPLEGGCLGGGCLGRGFELSCIGDGRLRQQGTGSEFGLLGLARQPNQRRLQLSVLPAWWTYVPSCLQAVAQQLRQLRTALAVAVALNRTIIMPRVRRCRGGGGPRCNGQRFDCQAEEAWSSTCACWSAACPAACVLFEQLAFWCDSSRTMNRRGLTDGGVWQAAGSIPIPPHRSCSSMRSSFPGATATGAPWSSASCRAPSSCACPLWRPWTTGWVSYTCRASAL